MKITLRDSTADDLGFAFNLNKTNMRRYVEEIRAWDDGLELEDMRRKFTPGIDKIVQVDGEDAGLLRTVEEDNAVKLDHIELLPKFQSKGIGSRLINDLIEKNKNKAIVLRVLKVNPAVGLYKRLGFTITSENDTKYFMRREAGRLK